MNNFMRLGYFGQVTSSVESSSYLLLYTADSYLKRFNILVILGVLNGFNKKNFLKIVDPIYSLLGMENEYTLVKGQGQNFPGSFGRELKHQIVRMPRSDC